MPIEFQVMECLKRYKLGSAFTFGLNGVAQVKRALDSVPGILTGYASEWLGYTPSRYIH